MLPDSVEKRIHPRYSSQQCHYRIISSACNRIDCEPSYLKPLKVLLWIVSRCIRISDQWRVLSMASEIDPRQIADGSHRWHPYHSRVNVQQFRAEDRRADFMSIAYT